MSNIWTAPKLVMGYIEVVAPDGESGIPYDDAVIHLEGDEDSEIEVHCPAALRLAPLIVTATNNHVALLEMLDEARLQLEYLHEKHRKHSTTEGVLARIRHTLAAVGTPSTGPK